VGEAGAGGRREDHPVGQLDRRLVETGLDQRVSPPLPLAFAVDRRPPAARVDQQRFQPVQGADWPRALGGLDHVETAPGEKLKQRLELGRQLVDSIRDGEGDARGGRPEGVRERDRFAAGGRQTREQRLAVVVGSLPFEERLLEQVLGGKAQEDVGGRGRVLAAQSDPARFEVVEVDVEDEQVGGADRRQPVTRGGHRRSPR
jgi:hypothetical protein